MIEAAHRRLGTARVAAKLAQQKHIDTKATLGNCISAWVAGVDPGSAEDRRARELRNHLKGEAEKRAQRGYVPRMSTAQHPAFDPVSGKSGFKGNRRGAFGKADQHRSVNDARMFQGKPSVKA